MASTSTLQPSTGKTIDVNDPKWQVSSSFGPDKQSTWPYPMEKDGWMHAHNSIRAEVEGFKVALEKVMEVKDGGRMPAWAIDSIQKWWAGHSEHVHGHHHNEDEILNPELRTRFKYPEQVDTDHQKLIEHMDGIEKIIDGLQEGDSAKALYGAWISYQEDLFPHLAFEEAIGLPLFHAYFTPQEGGAIVGKIIQKCTPIELGSLIHCMGEDAFRNEFMPQEGIPFFVWYLQFGSFVTTYNKEMYVHLKALQSLEPPKIETKKWFQFC